jgi:hypothetical protein
VVAATMTQPKHKQSLSMQKKEPAAQAPPLTRQAYLSMNVASAARAIAQPCCRPLGR